VCSKRVAPLAGLGGSLVGMPALGLAAREFTDKAEKIAIDEKDPNGSLARELGTREQAGLIDLGARHLLARLIKSLDTKRGGTDPEYGGLHPYHLKEDGRLLWLCVEHRDQYENTR